MYIYLFIFMCVCVCVCVYRNITLPGAFTRVPGRMVYSLTFGA